MRRQPGIRHQQGAVLLVALIFLVVLTVAGVTAMRFATIEERMASNVQFRNQAFQSALSELRYQLLALNQNLANRAPLLVAMSNGPEDPDPVTNPIMKILPDSTKLPQALVAKMPKHVKKSEVRATTEPGICTDSVNSGSSVGSFECLEFELEALAALVDICPDEDPADPYDDYKCGANSSQAMGISFVNNN